MSKRKNTFTRFIEDIVDDTKDFVDDIIDRAKDLETDTVDAIKDVVDDDESDEKVSSPGVAELEAALAELTAKVNQLAELQLAAASSSNSASSSNLLSLAAPYLVVHPPHRGGLSDDTPAQTSPGRRPLRPGPRAGPGGHRLSNNSSGGEDMAKRKSFGNPFSKTLGKVIDKVAPEVLDSAMDVASGPGKSKKSSTSSSGRSTDWATRAPAHSRGRKRH